MISFPHTPFSLHALEWMQVNKRADWIATKHQHATHTLAFSPKEAATVSLHTFYPTCLFKSSNYQQTCLIIKQHCYFSDGGVTGCTRRVNTVW